MDFRGEASGSGPIQASTLAEGDIISIDCGVTLDGWVSDSARTIAVGTVSQVATDLMDATRRSLVHRRTFVSSLAHRGGRP